MILTLFGTFFLLIILGIPIAVAIGISSFIVLRQHNIPLILIAQRMFAGTDSFPLVAVPFFILAGDLMAKGKVSEKLVEFGDALVGFVKGGLWIVSVIASIFFSAISGSGAATTAAVGTPLIPELRKKKYDPAFSAALIAAAGAIGVVIPPSVPMILYCVIADQSVARLFLNGFIPGVLMGIALIGIALQKAYRENYPRGAKFSWKHVWYTFKDAFWGLLTPAIILGGIFSGYFTPSEAAVIAVDYSLFVAIFIYKDLKWKDIYKIVVKSAITTSVVMLLIATSNILSWVLANWQIPIFIAQQILALSQNKYVILFLITFIILLAGVFMETASALIILAPVFLPLINELGINLIHFGLIMVIGLAIGMITPPVAINLYVASTISDLSLEEISRAIVPLLVGLIGVYMLVTYLPLFINLII